MEKPDLNRMWETFVKIGMPYEVAVAELIRMIRSKICPAVSNLTEKKMVDWYHFLIHNRNSGVPTTKDDDNLYFHIRFQLRKDINPHDFLPDYCVMTRKIAGNTVESISGIDKSLLKNEEIEEAWRIIGEQSEWLLEMLNIHKDNVDIPPMQIAQFLHFFANMTQLSVR